MRLTVLFWLVFAAACAAEPRPVDTLLSLPLKWDIPNGYRQGTVRAFLAMGGQADDLPFSPAEIAVIKADRQGVTVVHPVAVPMPQHCPPGGT